MVHLAVAKAGGDLVERWRSRRLISRIISKQFMSEIQININKPTPVQAQLVNLFGRFSRAFHGVSPCHLLVDLSFFPIAEDGVLAHSNPGRPSDHGNTVAMCFQKAQQGPRNPPNHPKPYKKVRIGVKWDPFRMLVGVGLT